MSSFLTFIPVDVEAIKALLPKESHIEGVTWNGKELELRWGNGRLLSPFTFHVPFSVENLKNQQLPMSVTHKPAPAPQTEPTHTHVVPPVAQSEPKKKGRRA